MEDPDYYYASFCGKTTIAYNGIFKVPAGAETQLGSPEPGLLTDADQYHHIRVTGTAAREKSVYISTIPQCRCAALRTTLTPAVRQDYGVKASRGISITRKWYRSSAMTTFPPGYYAWTFIGPVRPPLSYLILLHSLIP
jgi:hypothetical protein